MSGTQEDASLVERKMDVNLIADLAALLDKEQIPHLLWGNWVLTFYGVPTIVDGITFIVEDTDLQRAFEAISGVFPPCTFGPTCLDSPEHDRRYFPAPSQHVHLTPDVPISLFNKSEILWRLPHLGSIMSSSGASGGKPDAILASDALLLPSQNSLGDGRVDASLYPVKIPAPWRFTEALILLLKRDEGNAYDSYWMSQILYMMEYVEEKGVLDVQDLELPQRRFYESVKSGPPGECWKLL